MSRTNRKQRIGIEKDTTNDGVFPSEVCHSIRGGQIDKRCGTVWGRRNTKKTKKDVGQRLRQARKRQDKEQEDD